jgi:uncharacterized protein (UPF0248 family)
MDGGLKGRRLVSQKRIERVRDASAGEIAVIIYRLQYTEKRGEPSSTTPKKFLFWYCNEQTPLHRIIKVLNEERGVSIYQTPPTTQLFSFPDFSPFFARTEILHLFFYELGVDIFLEGGAAMSLAMCEVTGVNQYVLRQSKQSSGSILSNLPGLGRPSFVFHRDYYSP